MMPLMPDTVRIPAPSNLATSRRLLNMPPTKAVWRWILKGSPRSFSFLTMCRLAPSWRTTPVALMRQFCGQQITPASMSCRGAPEQANNCGRTPQWLSQLCNGWQARGTLLGGLFIGQGPVQADDQQENDICGNRVPLAGTCWS